MNQQISTEWQPFAALVGEVASCDPAEIRPHLRLVEDLGMDSLSLVEFIVAIGERYGDDGLLARLNETGWEGVTVGELFEENARRNSSPGVTGASG